MAMSLRVANRSRSCRSVSPATEPPYEERPDLPHNRWWSPRCHDPGSVSLAPGPHQAFDQRLLPCDSSYVSYCRDACYRIPCR